VFYTELFTAAPFTSRIRFSSNVPTVGQIPDHLSQIKLAGSYSSMLSLLHSHGREPEIPTNTLAHELFSTVLTTATTTYW